MDTSGEPQAPSFAKEVKKGDIPKDFVSFFEKKCPANGCYRVNLCKR